MEGTIGEIRFFAGNFAPKNWAFCSSQIINIASNTALFSILGTTYGGNGTTTFGLPDFRGRTAVGQGNGPGLSQYVLGQMGGTNSVTVLTSNLPAHSHIVNGTVSMNGNAGAGNAETGQNAYPAALPGTNMYATGNNGGTLHNLTHNLGTSTAGSNIPVDIEMPFLGMNYIICMYGIFPARN